MASRDIVAVSREAEVAGVQLGCWGDFAIVDRVTGADIKPRGRKARAVLAYLALHAGRRIRRERLAGLLWGERGDEQARLSLRQTIFELKTFTTGEPPLLHVERDTVMLDPAALRTDVDAMREHLDRADYDGLLAALPDPGDVLLADLDGVDPGFDDWLMIERSRQRDDLVMLIGDASANALAAGQVRAARALHARLLEFDPDRDTPVPTGPQMPGPAASAAVPRPTSPRALPVAAALLLAAGSISGALWYRAAPLAAKQTDRDAQELYEAAHQIVYQRNGAQLPVAVKLLERSLLLQPDNVPAMAELAAAMTMLKPASDDHPEAERLARRAVYLAPGSAMAHGILGMVLGFQSKEAREEIEKAATLDRRDPQIQFWLSNVLGDKGDYPGRLEALRRAVAADPSWHRASGSAALAASELGYREEAANYTAQLRAADPSLLYQCDYAVDWTQGRYAEVVRDTLAMRDRLSVADGANWKLGLAMLTLGHMEPARLLLRLTPPLWRVASGAGPASGELEPLLIEADRDGHADMLASTALSQTLRAGRPAEIVAAYDRRVGRLGLLASGDASHEGQVTDGLQVALALRAAGRDEEARELLARADAAVAYSLGRGAVPNWLYAAMAELRAIQGRRGEALAALEIAVDRGWHYSPLTPLPDIADIPAFAGLHGDARFERLRKRLNDHIRDERRALGPIPS